MTPVKGFIFISIISETLFMCIYLFSNGFLLSRDVVEVSSFCNDFHNDTKSCWLPKRYSKLIYIMIDGLRFDFAYYNESINIEEKQHFENNLKVFHELQQQYPLNSRLSKLISDAPTVTVQRLKGLTTGSLPTFIDAGSNFVSNDIGKEDNIVDQFKHQGKRIVCLGDDMWEMLFPGRFHRSHFFTSFNINDLHTVDDGILDVLEDEINKTDWEVLIAHFLGVDHVGHWLGPKNHRMKDKLIQMDAALRIVIKLMDEETLLVVLGDHGMTNNGDHGGEAEDEVTSALFLYSKKPFFTNIDRNHAKNGIHVVDQIDLVPTLALLFDVPIPYSNIGKVMADLFEDSVTPLELNVRQVYRYLHDELPINLDSSQWNYIRNEYKSVLENCTVAKASHFLDSVKAICRQVWVKFNINKMLVCICQGALLLLFYSQILTESTQQITNILVSFLVTHVTWLIFFIGVKQVLWVPPIFLCYAVVGRIFVFDMMSVLTVCLFLISCTTSFSNGFSLHEHLIAHYLISSLASILAYCITINYKKCNSISPYFRKMYRIALLCYVILLIGTRLGFLSFRCREEQKWCHEMAFFHKSIESLPFATAVVRLIIALLIVYSVALLTLYHNKRYNICTYLTIINCFSVSLFWLAELFVININYLPLLSYFITIFIFIYYIFRRYINMLHNNIDFLINKKSDMLNKFIFSQKHHNNNDDYFVTMLFSSYAILLSNIFLSVLIILRSGYAISALLIVISAGCTLIIHSCKICLQTNKNDLYKVKLLPVLLWYFLSQEGFYITGHQMTFTLIHWPAAFVGFTGTNYIAAGTLVVIDTFASHILHGLTCPLLFLAPLGLSKWKQIGRNDVSLAQNQSKIMTCVVQYCSSYIMIHAVKILMTSTAALILRRHLMSPAIFAPHFIFEALGFGITCCSVLFGYIFVSSIIRLPQKYDLS